jgi:hypothetical protein
VPLRRLLVVVGERSMSSAKTAWVRLSHGVGLQSSIVGQSHYGSLVSE